MKKLFIIPALALMIGSGCTDATMSKMGGYGDTFTIKVLGPDTVITYHSTGKVFQLQSERSVGHGWVREWRAGWTDDGGELI